MNTILYLFHTFKKVHTFRTSRKSSVKNFRHLGGETWDLELKMIIWIYWIIIKRLLPYDSPTW